MMLARDNESCHAARSLDLNPIDHLLDLLERKTRAQPLQLNLRELMRFIRQTFAAIPQHILSKSTRYLAVDAIRLDLILQFLF